MLEKYINEINTFDDFYTIASSLADKEKGDLFEELTKYLFMFHPFYVNITKNIWLYDEVPIKLKEYLNLPPKDEGIDLIMLSNDNKYFAIQSKFRMNKEVQVQWKELGTFVGLTFGIADNFSGGFFVTNTVEINKNIRNSKKIVSVYGDFFDEILENTFVAIKSHLLKTSKYSYKIFKPLSHQNTIIDKSLSYFAVNDRGYLEMACGTGKTLTTYWINQKMNNKLTVIAVPSLYLLTQFFKEWANQVIAEKRKQDFILVGSDADVGDDQEYFNNGLLITTESKVIRKKIRKIIANEKFKGHEMHRITIITTYQSSDKLIAALNKLKMTPDLCIFDEAHKTVGSANKQFNLLLDDKNLMIKKRLFMTATPRIFKGDGDKENILSMDNEEWYGEQIYLYNTSNAIKDGHLNDYQILTIYSDDKYITDAIAKNKYVNIEKVEDNESHYVASAILLLNALKNKESHHLVTYHNSINKSKKFKFILESLMKYYSMTVNVYHLDGDMSMHKRNTIIKDFVNSDISILTSARVLNEGINIPVIDGICFVDPRMSTIDVVQCIGRALRLHPKKKLAKIFVPIMIEDINNVDENKVFGNVIRIIKNMMYTDTGITDYFIAKKIGQIPNRIILRSINSLSTEKVSENISIEEWMAIIEFKLWEKADIWEYKYNEVKKWIKDNRRIPNDREDAIEKSFTSWCGKQRQNKRANRLHKEKIDKLEKLDGWYWGSESVTIQKPFDQVYEELKLWLNINKRIPILNQKNETEYYFANWCGQQRKNKKAGRLNKEKIDKLEKLDGWIWSKKPVTILKTFDETYEELKLWIDSNNRFPVRNAKNTIEKYFAKWCNHKRQDQKAGRLNKEKNDKLEQLDGWYWTSENTIKTRTFEEVYEELRQWVILNNTLPSRNGNSQIEKSLGNWCQAKRGDKKKGKLNNEIIEKLEQLEGWYWT